MTAAWMTYAVVASIPVVLGTTAVAAVLRRHRMAERGAWLVGIGVLVGIPALRLLPRRPGQSVPDVAEILDLGLPTVVGVKESGLLSSLDEVALIGWAVLSLVTAVVLATSVRRLQARRRAWVPEVRHGCDVWISEDVGPAVVGVLRPVIVLPRWIRQVPEPQLDLIIRHELQHVRAGDPWVVAAIHALRVALPWHPGVWVMTAGLRQALELDCDRRVLEGRSDVLRYGEAVLTVASHVRPGPARPVAAFIQPVHFIKRRLMAMTQPRRSLGRYGALGLAALAALTLVGACETPVPSMEPEGVDEELQVEQALASYEVPYTTAPSILNRAEIVQNLEAHYPPLLRDAGVGGTVRMMIFIDEHGMPQDTRVDETSGHQALDDAAIRIAGTIRFSAALKDAEPVPTWIAVPITFAVR